MADTYYAWSEIRYGAEHDKNRPELILKQLTAAPGDKVTAAQLGLDEDQFQELVDSGSVRNYPLPEELRDPLTSPNTLIAQGLADSETVAATVGVSPELVQQYMSQKEKPTKGEVAK